MQNLLARIPNAFSTTLHGPGQPITEDPLIWVKPHMGKGFNRCSPNAKASSATKTKFIPSTFYVVLGKLSVSFWRRLQNSMCLTLPSECHRFLPMSKYRNSQLALTTAIIKNAEEPFVVVIKSARVQCLFFSLSFPSFPHVPLFLHFYSLFPA